MNAMGLGNVPHVEAQATSSTVAVLTEVLKEDLKTRLRENAQRVEEQKSVLTAMGQDILRNK